MATGLSEEEIEQLRKDTPSVKTPLCDMKLFYEL
jgi:hypothetical protein